MTPIPKKENGNNDWVEYRKLVLGTMNDLKIDVAEIQDVQILIRLDVRELKVRAAIWGASAATVISVIIGAITTKLVGLW